MSTICALKSLQIDGHAQALVRVLGASTNKTNPGSFMIIRGCLSHRYCKHSSLPLEYYCNLGSLARGVWRLLLETERTHGADNALGCHVRIYGEREEPEIPFFGY